MFIPICLLFGILSTVLGQWQKCSNRNALRRDPANCKQYQWCLDGYWVTGACERGYYFHPEYNGCVQGNCDGRETCNRDGDRRQNPTNCKQFQWCDSGAWSTVACPNGYFYDPNSFACREGECPKAPCEERKREIRADPNYCNAYMYCRGGQWVSYWCPAGMWYNARNNYCIQGPCQEPCSVHGSMRAKPSDCSIFQTCVYGYYVDRRCPRNLIFDEYKLTCVRGTCPTTTPAPTTTETPTTEFVTPEVTTETPTTEGEELCDELGKMRPKPGDCQIFQTCRPVPVGEMKWVDRSCPKGTVFHLKYMTCIEGKSCEDVPTDEPTIATTAGGEDGESTEATEETAETQVTEIENGGRTEKAPTEVETDAITENAATEPETDASTENAETEAETDAGTEGVATDEDNSGSTDGEVTEIETEASTDSAITEEGSSQTTIGETIDRFTTAHVETTTQSVDNSNIDRMECSVLGRVTADPTGDDRFYVCIYGKRELVLCPSGLIFNEEKKSCAHAVAGAECREGKAKSHVNDCKKFMNCASGKWEVQECPNGEQYNSVDGRCVQGFDCSAEEKCVVGTKRSSVEHCQKYEECRADGTWTVKDCLSGKIFNGLKNDCDEGQCGDGLKCGVSKGEYYQGRSYYPWTVSLLFKDDDKSKVNANVHECGGALINERWILTSRNCFIQWDDKMGKRTTPDPSRWKVKMGLDRRVVSAIIIQEVDSNHFGDLAMVKLANAETLTSYRNAICLPKSSETRIMGSDVLVTSWELHAEDQTFIPHTHAVRIPEKIPLKCNKFFAPLIGELKPDTDCVERDTFETSKCTRDTGSPVSYDLTGQFTLYATISGDLNCGLNKDPSLYQRVQPHLEWIKKIMDTI